MIADSSKFNKLRNVYTIRSTARGVTIQKRKIYYIKIKVLALIIIFRICNMNFRICNAQLLKQIEEFKLSEIIFYLKFFTVYMITDTKHHTLRYFHEITDFTFFHVY